MTGCQEKENIGIFTVSNEDVAFANGRYSYSINIYVINVFCNQNKDISISVFYREL